jgi:hypothetical protein
MYLNHVYTVHPCSEYTLNKDAGSGPMLGPYPILLLPLYLYPLFVSLIENMCLLSNQKDYPRAVAKTVWVC